MPTPAQPQQLVVPNDYTQTVQQAQAKQKILEALAANAMQQPQGHMAGQVYVGGANAGTALANILGTLAMVKGQDRVNDIENEAAKNYLAARNQAVTNYADQTANGPTRQQAVQAILSQYPEMQKLGQTDMDSLNKENTPFTRLIKGLVGGGGAVPAQPQVGPDGQPVQGAAPQQVPGRTIADVVAQLTPGLTPQEFAVSAAADPSGKQLAEAMLTRGKPMVIPESGMLVQPTGNGTARPVAGIMGPQAEQAGRIAYAKESAKAQLDPYPIENPQGTAYPTRAQVAGAGVGAPGALPATATPTNMVIPPSVQAGRDADRVAILRNEYVNAKTDADKQAIASELQRMGASTGAGGGNGTPTQPGGSTGVVPWNKSIAAADQAQRTKDIDFVTAQRDAAQKAGESLKVVNQIRQNLKGGTFGGAFASTQERAAAFANALGFQLTPKQLANTQDLQATLKSLALPQVKQLGFNPTDTDREYIDKMIGSINNDPAAFDKILDRLEQSSNNTLSQFKRMDEYQRNNGSLKGFDYKFDQSQGQLPTPEALGLPSGFKILRRID